MDLDVLGYELQWPPELFAEELAAVLRSDSWMAEVQLLLEDAFAGDAPLRDFDQAASSSIWDEHGVPTDAPRRWTHLLLEAAPHLRAPTASSPYYPLRQAASVAEPESRTRLAHEFASFVTELLHRGYLQSPDALPENCLYGPDEDLPNASTKLSHLLHRDVVWPLQPDSWDDMTLFGLIEVIHDLVARPRRRTWHEYDQCGWHCYRFVRKPAQVLYRGRVNTLLAKRGVALHLAADGEDVGRLVRAPIDSRQDLVGRVLDAPAGVAATTVEHAVSLFRRRGATREDKRSACIALAGLLEERRARIKVDLLSNDEGALFQIANKFGVRHRRADQQSDYAEDYLDWIFWLFLATVELTDRLLARGAGGSP